MRRSRWIRRGAVLLAAVVVLNVAVALVGRLTSRPTGPASSSYATAPAGLAAYADLLAREGRRVERVRERPDTAPLDPADAVVMLDPGALSARDAAALRRFVKRGGRLVAGGVHPGTWLPRLLPKAPTWARDGERRAVVLAPAPEAAGVAEVASAGAGAWRNAGGALPVLGGRAGWSRARTLLAVAGLGRGRIVLLADASPLQNRLLARADNAALALAVAGEPGRTVSFLESVHGFGEATGVEAIPTGWRVALVGLGLAGIVFMVARGRRLGPPERARRALSPPRSAFVRALALNLQRAGRPAEGLAPLQDAARRRLEHRAGVRRDADDGAVRRAGARLGLPGPELDAVLGDLRADDQVMAAGRALARLEGRAR